jgi:anti-anti-sigma factor
MMPSTFVLPPVRRRVGDQVSRHRTAHYRSSVDLSAEFEVAGDSTVLYLRGEIDLSNADRLRDALAPHLDSDRRLVIDLGGVEFLDSSCLAVLVQSRGLLEAAGGRFLLREPSRVAAEVLRLSGLDFLLEDG